MKTYQNRRNGAEVEAVQLSEETAGEATNWTQGQLIEERNSISGDTQPGINVNTFGGMKRACVGDYIVKHGENFYVINATVFDDFYEEVGD